jgi:hypothetical protein
MSGNQAEHHETKSPVTRHHYDFGQVVLREACSFNPMAFFQVLASPGKEEFLESLWRVTCERCDGKGPARFSSTDVAVDSLMLEKYPTILVTMPPPRVMTEAFYIAVVLLVPMDRIVAGDIPEQPAFGYYTLELGIAPNDSRYTVLCAWVDGKHTSFGNGPDADPPAFLQAVSEKVLDSTTVPC